MARPARRSAGRRQGGWLSFFLGLMLGLSVALLVYLHPELVPARDPPPAAASVDPPRPTGPGPAGRPRFDFYTILPEREVKVPEWEAAPPPAEPLKPPPVAAAQAPPKVAGPYMIQVGSFQRYQDADRVKAKLALAGVSAGIQRVVINGSDVWYRVRIGPFGDLASLQGTRQRLTEGHFNYMLVRVKPGEGAG